MKVLIITYYWVPAGGSGVQRWLKFAKYLTEFGITPVIYAPENANYPTIDKKLLEEVPEVEVLKRPIFNPQDLIPTKNKKAGVANLNKGGLLSWIRGNLFIPDAKVFWIKPSVKYLKKYIKEHNIDVVISSGPPHSMHLIAHKLKQKTNVKWIADFRDPWTTLYYLEDFNLSNFAKRKNKKLEQQVLKSADAVITVSDYNSSEYKDVTQKVVTITNGYDDEVLFDVPSLDEKFSIAHIGLLPKQRNPKLLWKVLKELSEEDEQFKKDLCINLTGNVCQETLDDIKNHELQENLQLNGYVTHKKAIELQKKAQVLMLFISNTESSKGTLTGKLFEYLTTKRPILAIGNVESDLAKVLEDTKTGLVIDFEDRSKLKSKIVEFYKKYLAHNLEVIPKDIHKFHRKELTRSLAKIIKEL